MNRLVLLFVIVPCFAFAQSPRVISFQELEQWTQRNTDSLYIFNFWATWCKPCIEEMPAFDSLHTAYNSRKVQVIFVSLDFRSQLESRVTPFLKKRKFQAPAVLLNAPDANAWIDRISPAWSGAIPATLLIRNSDQIRQFHERQFTFSELQSLIQPLLEKP